MQHGCRAKPLYKRIPVSSMLGVTWWWTSIPSRKGVGIHRVAISMRDSWLGLYLHQLSHNRNLSQAHNLINLFNSKTRGSLHTCLSARVPTEFLVYPNCVYDLIETWHNFSLSSVKLNPCTLLRSLDRGYDFPSMHKSTMNNFLIFYPCHPTESKLNWKTYKTSSVCQECGLRIRREV